MIGLEPEEKELRRLKEIRNKNKLNPQPIQLPSEKQIPVTDTLFEEAASDIMLSDEEEDIQIGLIIPMLVDYMMNI